MIIVMKCMSFGTSDEKDIMEHDGEPHFPCILQLHAPPGGSSSFSIGWNSEPAPVEVPRPGRKQFGADPYLPSQPAPAPSAYTMTAYAAPAAAPSAYGPYGGARPAQEPGYDAYSATPPTAPIGGPGVSSNAYATGANQNSGALKLLPCLRVCAGLLHSKDKPFCSHIHRVPTLFSS